MVYIVLKQNEDSQFLFETSSTASTDDTTRSLAQIHNLRLKLENLANELDKIAQNKVEPPISNDENNNNNENNQPTINNNYIPETLDARVKESIEKSVADARAFLSKVGDSYSSADR